MSGSVAVLRAPGEIDADTAGSRRADCERLNMGETKGEQQQQQQQLVAGQPPVPAQNVEAKERKVLIFDWDDTLLCSTWLASEGLRLDSPAIIPPQTVAELNRLEASVVSLLERAMTYGEVIIITNAETGWVELSAARFMPKVRPLVDRVRVISARSTYEQCYPDNPYDWKVAAFRKEIGERVLKWDASDRALRAAANARTAGQTAGSKKLQQMQVAATTASLSSASSDTERSASPAPADDSDGESKVPSRKGSPEPAADKGAKQKQQQQRRVEPFVARKRTVISFGDSVHERDAVWAVTGEMETANTKSIKFVERPTLEQLCREVNLVFNCMDYVCTYEGDLDLMLTISLLNNQGADGAQQQQQQQQQVGMDTDDELDEEMDDGDDLEDLGDDDCFGAEGGITPSSSTVSDRSEEHMFLE